MPDIDNDDKRMTIVLPEGQYDFDADTLLTRSVLSHVKGWFPNTDLGTFWGLQQNLGVGDPDAAACAAWIVRRKEGFSPNPEPRNFARRAGDPNDFAVGAAVIAPNRRSDLDPPRWVLRLDGEEYVLDLDADVYCSQLRQIAKWYPQLGTFAGLYINLLRGDPDSVACAIWLARSKHGVNPNPSPRDIEDFSVGVVSAAPNLPDEFDEPSIGVPDPTETGKTSPRAGIPTTSTTGPSTETPTNSGGDSLLPSPTTAPE